MINNYVVTRSFSVVLVSINYKNRFRVYTISKLCPKVIINVNIRNEPSEPSQPLKTYVSILFLIFDSIVNGYRMNDCATKNKIKMVSTDRFPPYVFQTLVTLLLMHTGCRDGDWWRAHGGSADGTLLKIFKSHPKPTAKYNPLHMT